MEDLRFERKLLRSFKIKMTITQAIPKKGALLKPAIPLVDNTVIDVDKTELVTYTLKVRPNGPNEQTYKKTVKQFSSGTVEEWIRTMQDMYEIWVQSGIRGVVTKVAIAQSILKDEAQEQFMAGLAERNTQEDMEEDDPVMMEEDLENALNSVSLSVFPHRALQVQKL